MRIILGAGHFRPVDILVCVASSLRVVAFRFCNAVMAVLFVLTLTVGMRILHVRFDSEVLTNMVTKRLTYANGFIRAPFQVRGKQTGCGWKTDRQTSVVTILPALYLLDFRISISFPFAGTDAPLRRYNDQWRDR